MPLTSWLITWFRAMRDREQARSSSLDAIALGSSWLQVRRRRHRSRRGTKHIVLGIAQRPRGQVRHGAGRNGEGVGLQEQPVRLASDLGDSLR